MNNLNDILNKVGVITSQPNDIRSQIIKISESIGVDIKTATVLHFASKDGDWNENVVGMLDDVIGNLPINEMVASDEEKKKREFYLMNYLKTRWSEPALEHIQKYEGMSFFNVWLRQLTSQIIRDVEIIGIYPEDKSEFVVDRNFPGDGLVHPLISDWLVELIRKVKPEYRS